MAVGADAVVGVRVLGAPVIERGTLSVSPARQQDQRVLARLALASGQSVSSSDLAAVLWSEDAPASWRRSLQNAVLRLRRAAGELGLTDAFIETVPDGYRLAVALDLDVDRLEALLAEAGGRADHGRWAAAGSLLARVVEAIPDDPIPYGSGHPYWEAIASRWRENRVGATEDLLVAEVRAGRRDLALAVAEPVVVSAADNERLQSLWAVALVQAGQAARAAESLRRFLGRLTDRGLEPSPELAALERMLPAADPDQALTLLDDLDRRPEAIVVPFVGREEEAARLAELVAGARASSRLVAVSGPPGIGKSTLVGRVVADLDPDQHLVLQGRCWAEGQAPYGPLIEALRPVFTPDHADELRANVALHGGQLTRLVPADRWPFTDVPSAPSLDAPRPELLHEAVASLLEMLAVGRVLVLVLEDLQWASPSLRALVSYVASRRVSTGLLLVVTHRPDAPRLQLDRGVDAVELVLGALPATAVNRLLEHYGLDPAAREQLVRLSEGRPLWVRYLAQVGDGLGQGSLGRLEPLGQLLRRQLEELGDVERIVIDVLALIGDAVVPTLVGVLEAEVGEESLSLALARLERLHLIGSQEGVWSLSHDVLRSIVAESIPPLRRAHLHRRIGEALAGSEGALPAQVADHLVRAASAGHRREDVLPWLLRAADEALVELAFDEAEAWYRRGLDLVDEPAPEGADDALDLRLALGELLTRVGRTDEAERLLLPLWEQALAQGDPELPARVALALSGDTWAGRDRFDDRPLPLLREALERLPASSHHLRSRVHLRLGFLASSRGDTVAVLFHVDAALQEAEQTRDPAVVGEALGGALALSPPHVELARHRARARKILETGRMLGARDLVVTGMIHEATAGLMAGDDPGLDRFARLVHLLTTEHREPFARPATSLLAFLRGDLAGAEASIRRQLAQLVGASGSTDLRMGLLAQLVGLLRLQGRLGDLGDVGQVSPPSQRTGRLGDLGLARALVDLGQRDAARALAEAIVDDLPDLLARVPAGALFVLGEVSELVVELAAVELVEPVERQLTPHAELHCSSWIHLYGGAVTFHLGRLALVRGDLVAARSALQDAARRHERLRVLPYVARSYLSLADLERAQPDGDRDAVLRLLDRAEALARPAGMASLADRAVAGRLALDGD